MFTPPSDSEKTLWSFATVLDACALVRTGNRIGYNFIPFAEAFYRQFKDTPSSLLKNAFTAALRSRIACPETDMSDHWPDDSKVPTLPAYVMPAALSQEIEKIFAAPGPTNVVGREGLMRLQEIFCSELQQRLGTVCLPIPNIKKTLAAMPSPSKKAAPSFIMNKPNINSISNSPDPLLLAAVNMKERYAWEIIKDILTAAGAEVKTIRTPKQTSLRRAFVRDPLIILPEGIVIRTHTESEVLFTEQCVMEETLKRLGYKDFRQSSASVQGGNVICCPEKKLLFVGGFDKEQCELNAAALNKDTPGYRCIPLLMNPAHKEKLFHLDFCLGYAGKGKFLVCQEALAEESQRLLATLVGRDNLLSVSLSDAKKQAYNITRVGNMVVSPHANGAVTTKLRRSGIYVVDPSSLGLPEGAFDISHGSVHCVTNEISTKTRAR